MNRTEQHDHPTETIEGCEPLAICMVCLTEFSVDVSECDKCHVPLSVVRRCPGCSRIVSARHSKCVYCGRLFVIRPIASSASATQPKHVHHPISNRILRTAIVGVAVYTLVFSLVFYATRKLDHRTAPRPLSRIASSYALRRAPIYANSSLTGVPIGQATGPVEVLDFATAGNTALWWHITSTGGGGFVRPGDFAPPNAIDPEKGYTLLRCAILAADERGRLLLAVDAVQHYRNAFPVSAHRDDLSFLVAEQGQRVAVKTRDTELLSRARDLYSQLASSGQFSEEARRMLQQLPRPDQSWAPTLARPTADLQVVGGDLRRQSSVDALHTVTLSNQEEISVQLPPMPHATKGSMLAGTVLENRPRQRDHYAVPAGSPCIVRVVETVAPLSPASDGALILELQGVSMQGRWVIVNAGLLRVPLPATARDDHHPWNVVFTLRAPLIVPE